MQRRQATERKREFSAIAQLLRPARGPLLIAGLCSAAINVLALTGPLYMIEVYGAALPSRSLARLLALTLAMLGLYALGGAFDLMRQRLLARAAQRVDVGLGARAFAALHEAPRRATVRREALEPVRDLDQIRSFLCGQGPAALFDLPWIPLYLGAIFILHPWLGLLAVAGAMLLAALMVLAELTTAGPARQAAHGAARRWSFAVSAVHSAPSARAMGFTHRLQRRWQIINCGYGKDLRAATRPAAVISSAGKALRPALQSCMLGLGAFLVITEHASAAAMFAASIILSRALARALFGEPFLLVLDEANANLDAEGERLLADAIVSVRARGGIVVVVTHRRSALAGIDDVLALGAGRVLAYGAKEAVLAHAVERSPAVRERAMAL